MMTAESYYGRSSYPMQWEHGERNGKVCFGKRKWTILHGEQDNEVWLFLKHTTEKLSK